MSPQRTASLEPLDVARSHALRVWREHHGLSQRQLAELLGVAQTTIYDWEAGRAPLDTGRERVIAMLTTFGWPVSAALAWRRRRLGLSLAAVGREVGCSGSHVRDLELGVSPLRGAEQERFDAAFQVLQDGYEARRDVHERISRWQQTLRARRLQAEVSQQRLARQLDVNVSTLGDWERLAATMPAHVVITAERILRTTTPDRHPPRIVGGPYAATEWGTGLRRRRNALGLSLGRLATTTQLQPATIGAWEHGRRRAPQRYADRVDRALARLEAERQARIADRSATGEEEDDDRGDVAAAAADDDGADLSRWAR